MASFNEWLTVSDPQLLAEHLAEQFRLSQNELRKVSEALAPAFALGLRRAMNDRAAAPDLSRAFSAMMPGSGYGAASVPNSLPGQAFVEAFFGSDALAGAVARQASLFAGIAPDTIQKLMPGLALLTMETMARAVMADAERHRPSASAAGDLGAAAAEMMRRGAKAVEALSRPSDVPVPSGRAPVSAGPTGAFLPGAMADLFAAALRGAVAPMAAGAAAPSPAKPKLDEAPGDFELPGAMAALFGPIGVGTRRESRTPALPPSPAPLPKRGRKPVPRSGGIADDIMRSGEKIREDYAKEMAMLFERYGGSGGAV